MPMKPIAMLAAVPLVVTASSSVLAGSAHRWRHEAHGHVLHETTETSQHARRVSRRAFSPLVPPTYGAAQPTDNWNAPGAIIAAATRRAQHDPGVTLELAPDAKETATGGPVGGVPGFDGS